MAQTSVTPLFRDTRSDWVRLQTLTQLRWLAIAGQLLAIAVGHMFLDLRLPLAACLGAVGLSIGLNLLIEYIFPQSQRLTEAQALILLTFDMGQLSLLLFLTGGLTNPFALLILAPVTISTSVLGLRSTMTIGVLGIFLVSALVLFNLPLRQANGAVLAVPTLFLYGFWFAIVIGILFIGGYSRRVASEIRAMSDAMLAAQMALTRQQKLTDLGGVVAAAAHELGTPLATMKLVSTEMIDELEGHPDLQDDARLIRDQTDRCRDILRSMGQQGKDDLHLRQAPLITVIREAAEPHLHRGKTVRIELAQGEAAQPLQPLIRRSPEVIHGLRNLIQNAVDFAASRVWVVADWSESQISLRVVDDGAGYPPQMLGRIGDPFLRARRSAADTSKRPEYEGMGLGLFIAKTLLERSGAKITFSNGGDVFLKPAEHPDRCGAVVDICWPRSAIEADIGIALGVNQPNDP